MGESTAGNGAPAAAAQAVPPPTMRRNDISMTDMSDMDNGDKLYHVRKSRLIRLINWWQVSSGRGVRAVFTASMAVFHVTVGSSKQHFVNPFNYKPHLGTVSPGDSPGDA